MLFFRYLIRYLVYLLFLWVDISIWIEIIDYYEERFEVGNPENYGKLEKIRQYSCGCETEDRSFTKNEIKTSVESQSQKPVKDSYICGSGLLWVISIIAARVLLGV